MPVPHLKAQIHSENQNCRPVNKPPYYLDFEQDSNSYTDNLGRKFETSRDINTSQTEIDRRFLRKMTDWTERFRDEREGHQPQMILKVDPQNDIDPLYPVPQNTNPHSFWGINNSSGQSVEGMSESYLLMKQAQEQEQLANNAHYYQGLSEEVKAKQALEIQRHLETSGNNFVGGIHGSQASIRPGIASSNGFLSKDYVSANTQLGGSVCLNAQGEWLESNPQNYLMKNKYAHLKQMDPEKLNRMQGKPVADNCQPVTSNDDGDGDIFTQTSCNLNRIAPERLSTLQRLNQESQSKILGSHAKLESARESNPFYSSKGYMSSLYYSDFGTSK